MKWKRTLGLIGNALQESMLGEFALERAVCFIRFYSYSIFPISRMIITYLYIHSNIELPPLSSHSFNGPFNRLKPRNPLFSRPGQIASYQISHNIRKNCQIDFDARKPLLASQYSVRPWTNANRRRKRIRSSYPIRSSSRPPDPIELNIRDSNRSSNDECSNANEKGSMPLRYGKTQVEANILYATIASVTVENHQSREN